MITAPWLWVGALTLSEVQDRATRWFPTILAAEQELVQAQAEELAARGGFDPTLTARASSDALGYYRDTLVDVQVEQPTPWWGTSLSAGYRLGRGTFPNYALGLATNDFGEARAAVQVPVLRNGWIDRRRAGVTKASLGVDAGVSQRRQTVIEVVRAASQRFVAWVGASQRRRLAEQMLRLAQERDSQITTRVRSGDLAEVERIDNERTIAQREAALVQAERQGQQAAYDLALYLRDDEGRPWIAGPGDAPDDLLPPANALDDEDAAVRRALAARPDLARAEAHLSQQQVERDLQRNQLWPALDFRVQGSQDLGPGSATRKPFELTVGLTLELPLLFRSPRGRVQAAEAAVSRAQLQLQLQRDRVALEVKDARSAVIAATARYRAAARDAALSLELARLESTRFAHGESTIFVVNLRETGALEAQVRSVDAAVEAHRAAIELAAVTGLLARP